MNTIGRKKLLSLHGCLCTFKALLKMDAGIENDISVHTFEAFSILLTNTASLHYTMLTCPETILS